MKPFSGCAFGCITLYWNWQEFSSDMGSRTVKRIADVSRLRNYQFPQVLISVFFIFVHINLFNHLIICLITLIMIALFLC